MKEAIEKIARECLDVKTLEKQTSDERLNFYELAVWELKEALERAYEAGRESVRYDPAEEGVQASRRDTAVASVFRPGAEVVIAHNPHVDSATDVVGRVVAFRPGQGFGGCDLADVEFVDPATGERHKLPFGTHNLEPGGQELIARAERLEAQAVRLRRLAERMPG